MKRTTACAGSAWMRSLTVSCWSVGTWSPAPNVASAWVSVPSAGSMWCELCMFSSHEIEAPHMGHSSDSIPHIWVHKRDWKLTVPRQKLFLKIIFLTDWGQKVHPKLKKPGLCHRPVCLWAHGFPASAGLYHLSPLSTSCWSQTAQCGYLLLLSRGHSPCLLVPFTLCLELLFSSKWTCCWQVGQCGLHWAAAAPVFTVLVMHISSANTSWM